jgi:hypothetical protein
MLPQKALLATVQLAAATAPPLASAMFPAQTSLLFAEQRTGAYI